MLSTATIPRIEGSPVEAFLLKEADYEQLVLCVQRSFPEPDGEIMARVLGISAAEYLPYSERVCRKAVRDGLSVGLRNRDTGRVVAFLIGEDFASAPLYSEMTLSHRFQPLLCLLEQLDEWYRERYGVVPGRIFHSYMLGVEPGHAGRGLATLVARESERLARARGFERVLAEATGVGSQRVTEKLGYTRRFGIEYRSYLFEGERVFASIEAPTHCWLVEKSLG